MWFYRIQRDIITTAIGILNFILFIFAYLYLDEPACAFHERILLLRNKREGNSDPGTFAEGSEFRPPRTESYFSTLCAHKCLELEKKESLSQEVNALYITI